VILRLAAWILVALGIAWLVRRVFQAAPSGRDRPTAGRGSARSDGLLVRDPVCSTYVPKDRARVLRDDSGDEHYFFSERCEGRFLAARRKRDTE
jgi:YHS domain-containing protein